MRKLFSKRLVAFTGALALAASIAFPVAKLALAADCDANAIIWCGANDKSTLKNRIKNGDGHNSAANIQSVYKDFGIDVTDAGIDASVDGTVTKDGRVIVNGQTVATNVWSAGRTNIPGSQPVGSVFMRPTSVSFNSDSLPAFVSMKNGAFAWAVIKSCGNPVKTINKPFGDIKKRVTNVTQDASASKHAADTNATAVEVARGDEVRYEVTISNLGTATMTGIKMTDALPAGVTLKSNPSTRNIAKDFANINANNFSFFTITVKVDSNVADGTYITNKACFTANEGQSGCDVAIIKVKVPKVLEDCTTNPNRPECQNNQKNYECVELVQTPVPANDEKSLTRHYEVKFTQTNTTVTSFHWEFSDGTTGDTNVPSVDHTFAKSANGKYSAKVSVKDATGPLKTSAACAKEFTVSETPVCTVNCVPVVPECVNCGGGFVPPTTTPDTGMEGAAAGALGTSALGYAATAYRRSKRDVVKAVKSIAKR